MIIALCVFLLFPQTVTPEAIEHTQAGVEAQKHGRLDEAIQEFQKVVALAPGMASAYANLGNAYFTRGDYDQAIPALLKALQLNPQLLGAHQALGVALLVQGNAAEALPHLEKARNPELLGLAYLETGKLSDAIAALQVALEKKPTDPDLLYYFGQATSLASRKAFDRILESDAGSARAHQVAGDRYAEQGKMPQAGKEYFEALRIKPYTAGVHLALAQVLVAVGNWPAAILEFRAETKIRPANAEAFYGLGSALLHQGQTGDALTELARADELGPNTPPVLLALGKAALASGDPGRAEHSFRKLLDIQHDGALAAQAHFELAGFYRQAGKPLDAEREMKEYERLKEDPKQKP